MMNWIVNPTGLSACKMYFYFLLGTIFLVVSQFLTCASVSCSVCARYSRSGPTIYCCRSNSASNLSNCSGVKMVRTRFDLDEDEEQEEGESFLHLFSSEDEGDRSLSSETEDGGGMVRKRLAESRNFLAI